MWGSAALLHQNLAERRQGPSLSGSAPVGGQPPLSNDLSDYRIDGVLDRNQAIPRPAFGWSDYSESRFAKD